jgi:hypothetical protein
MPGYRQNHALYVLREIKWIVCQYIVFMEKCISVPHDREQNFAFLLMRKKYFDWGRFWKKNLRAQWKSQPPPPNKKMVVAIFIDIGHCHACTKSLNMLNKTWANPLDIV